jgi:hypothetical protein
VKSLAALAVATVLLVGGAASSATSFQVFKISETQNSITLGWARQPGDGYRFWRNGVVVSRTFDPSRTSVKFSKGLSYKVEVQLVSFGNTGLYPVPPPTTTGALKANVWLVP